MSASRVDTTPRRVAGARIDQSAGRMLILSPDGTVAVTVNDSAAAVFELCDGETSVAEMVSAICEVSSISPDRARDDVLRTLDELARLQLVDLT